MTTFVDLGSLGCDRVSCDAIGVSVHLTRCITQQQNDQDLSDHLETAERIRNIVTRLKLSQSALADILGVERSVVTRYLGGSSEPGPLPCLILASLSESDADKNFWLHASGINAAQMERLASAIGAPKPTGLDGSEIKLLSWWREPRNPMEDSLREVMRKVLIARDVDEEEMRKKTSGQH
jgi:transcriptional regulator with XRE-family HTH domain